MNITRETISFTCPSCGHTTKPHLAIKDLAQGRRLTCEKCGSDIPVDSEAFKNVEEILQRLGVPGAPDMPTGITTVTRSTVALQCPHCNTLSTVSRSLAQLGEGDKVFCQNCGKEIPIDRDKIHRAQSVVERLGDVTGNGTLDTPEAPVVVKTKTFSFNVNKNIEMESANRRCPIPTGRYSFRPAHRAEPSSSRRRGVWG